MIGLNGCYYQPECDEPAWARFTMGVLSLGLSEVVRAKTLDCSLYERGEELLEEGDAAERFEVSMGLWGLGETEHSYRLICLSAHQNEPRGQHFLAGGYWHSYLHYDVDYVQAYKWYSLAIVNGHKYSAERLEELAPKMTAAQIAEAERLVAEWEPNPAECELEAVGPG